MPMKKNPLFTTRLSRLWTVYKASKLPYKRGFIVDAVFIFTVFTWDMTTIGWYRDQRKHTSFIVSTQRVRTLTSHN